MKKDAVNQLQKVQECQLNILKSFKKACDEHGLGFYLAFGSALGAARHHGFIPWDDDIDIFMKIEDMKKLKEVQSSLPPNLFIQTREKEKEYGLLIARVRDSNTTLIEADHVDRDINHGVYIDIYPLFYCPENYMKMKMIVILSFFCRLFAYNDKPMNKGVISTSAAKILLRIFPNNLKKCLSNKLYHYIISQPASRYVSLFPEVSLGKRYLSEWFNNPALCEFEGEMMPMPSKIHDYLSFEYGDYMQLPPVEQRQIHHQYLFIDLETPYLKYKGVEYCTNRKE